MYDETILCYVAIQQLAVTRALHCSDEGAVCASP